MGKIAFVFSGQGAQHTGMGKELSEQNPAAAEIFRKADAIRPGTSEQCFEGSDEILSVTKNTQPCLFAMEMAAAAALKDAGIQADMAAGFSLGELAALTFAGMADFETMFSLVCKRGELMQEAAERTPAAMAAVGKLTADQVKEICGGFSEFYPVNFNCPGQVSVSGKAEEMKAFGEAVKAAGGRMIPLKVKGGFHSPFMETAAKAFREELSGISVKAPEIPVYANRTAAPYPGEGRETEMKELLAGQIISPVQWEQTIRSMIADGADTFVEIGPGETLCGMIKRIDKNVRTFPVEDIKGIKTMEAAVC